MEIQKKIESLREIYEGIFKLMDAEGITNGDKITLLESAKLDILLNKNIVIIDGKCGKSINSK